MLLASEGEPSSAATDTYLAATSPSEWLPSECPSSAATHIAATYEEQSLSDCGDGGGEHSAMTMSNSSDGGDEQSAVMVSDCDDGGHSTVDSNHGATLSQASQWETRPELDARPLDSLACSHNQTAAAAHAETK